MAKSYGSTSNNRNDTVINNRNDTVSNNPMPVENDNNGTCNSNQNSNQAHSFLEEQTDDDLAAKKGESHANNNSLIAGQVTSQCNSDQFATLGEYSSMPSLGIVSPQQSSNNQFTSDEDIASSAIKDNKGRKKRVYRRRQSATASNKTNTRPAAQNTAAHKSLDNVGRPFMAPPYLFPSTEQLSVIEREINIHNPDEDPDSNNPGKADNPKLTKRQKLLIATLALTNFSSTVVFACIAPFFPGVAEQKGASRTAIGLVFGIFELVLFITAPLFGKYITKIGSKFMFCTGLLVTGITSILFGLLVWAPEGTPFISLCFAVRIVEAIGDSMFVTASFAIVAHEFPGRVASIIGVLETFSGLGFTAGPPIGGALFEAGGFLMPFLVLGILLLFAGFVSIFLIPDQHGDTTHPAHLGMMSLFKIPVILLMSGSIVVCAASLSYLDPTLEPHLDDFHLTPTLVGFMFLLTGGVYTLTAPIWGFVVDKWTPSAQPIMVMGGVLSALGMLFIGPSPILYFKKSLWSVGISQVIIGLGIGPLFIPTFQQTLAAAMDHGFPETFETYGCVSGLFQACFSFGAFFGPTVGGVAVEHLGFGWSSTILAGMNLTLAICLCSFILYSRCFKREEVSPATSFTNSKTSSSPKACNKPLLNNDSGFDDCSVKV